MSESPPKELVILVADLDAQNALRGILARHKALGIRNLDQVVDIHRHLQRDAGCRCEAEEFLRSFSKSHRHALVVFDHDGCGWEHRSAPDIEADVEARLSGSGWKSRCGALVLDPELEIWVWSDSPHVDKELGWKGHKPSMREWLVEKQFLQDATAKPVDPKAAMLGVLRAARKPPSPRIFQNLAGSVSFDRCQDRAFVKLRALLQQWFS